MTQTNTAAKRTIATAETSFSRYADPLIAEAADQACALEGDTDAERLHELRVSLRRMRTLLWAYRPMLNDEFDTQQRAILKFLANAAGHTRDWDILIGLIEADSDQALLDTFKRHRDEASEKSRQTLTQAKLKKTLHDAVSEANRELNTSSARTPLTKFARKRVSVAQKQLKKRMRAASKKHGSDYASYHEVRKAGKKVRYLIEFFEPLLDKRRRKGLKQLKRLQKRLGMLNDVVASRDLLKTHRASLPDASSADKALKGLKRKQKRRMNAASKLL
jgi:CHAD domain-containing protein